MVTLEEIKKECALHKNCYECPIFMGDDNDNRFGECLMEETPADLDLKEIERRLHGHT